MTNTTEKRKLTPLQIILSIAIAVAAILLIVFALSGKQI